MGCKSAFLCLSKQLARTGLYWGSSEPTGHGLGHSVLSEDPLGRLHLFSHWLQ